MSLLTFQALAETTNSATKATATLAATCTISANSISFGTLATPLYAQSASSSMNVLCSKEAPYKIDLIFGLSSNYWQAISSGGSWNDSYWTTIAYEYDSSGKYITSTSFNTPVGTMSNTTIFESSIGCKYMADGKCHAINSSSDYGVMMGGAKGDSVSYTIFIPGDQSKVWSIGKNSYTATGIGTNQTIPINAQLVPSQSAAYPAPDFYSSTVTATITY